MVVASSMVLVVDLGEGARETEEGVWVRAIASAWEGGAVVVG